MFFPVLAEAACRCVEVKKRKKRKEDNRLCVKDARMVKRERKEIRCGGYVPLYGVKVVCVRVCLTARAAEVSKGRGKVGIVRVA